MYRITVEDSFSAAHAIRGHRGPCCRTHGHNYRVVVRLIGEELDDLGMLIDYTDVKRALAGVLASLDHSDLNALPVFAIDNPTSEALARYCYQRLATALAETAAAGRVHVAEVEVFESERQSATYWEPMAS
jgi:6-pyruvoyltetrahydropterin/6-carboxytetrahydropterin synthase